MPLESCQKYTATLSEVLALTPVVQTIADATDVPGVRLEWLNGAWYGDCGFPSAAQHSALLAANAYNSLGINSRATLPSGPVTWRGADAGWVLDSLAVRPIRSTPFEVMASPPTVAISTTHDVALTQMFRATGPGSAGGAFTQIGAIPFRFVKSHKITYSASTQQWDDAFVTSKAVQTGNSMRGAGILGVKFIFIGTVLEIMVSGNNQKHRIKVTEADGYSRYVSLTPTQSTNNGAYNYIKVTFSGYGQRTIEFQQQNATSAGFGGVYTEPTGTILPAPIVGPRILIAGDSFTEGTGTIDAGLSGYVQAISECLGVDDVCASGVGGTGYVATSGGSKPKLRDRLTADVLEIPHDICVFAMGINDYSISVQNSLTECELCITQYLASAPGRLVLASPYFTSSTMLLPSAFLQLYRGIKALAAKYSLDFIDLVQMPISSEIAPLTAQLTAPISAGGTSIVTTNVLPAGTSWEFADGTIINVTTSGAGSYGSKTTTLPFPISAAQASGATLTMVGNGFWTGNGKSGIPTGKGNSDIFVGGTDGNDTTHPTGNGHSALGYYLAARLAEILAKYKLW